MTDRWEEATSVFQAVLACDPADRAALLDRLCPGDSTLRAEVASLVCWHSTSSPFLETQPFSRPESLGPYRISGELGRGGMGVAYLAERADGHFQKKVAIRVVRSGDCVEKFRRERQILAELEHENIARLLDGGAEGGVQYLVMEYVQGVPIDRYCDERNLAVRERLRIFWASAAPC